jgi:hypothetical protein
MSSLSEFLSPANRAAFAQHPTIQRAGATLWRWYAGQLQAEGRCLGDIDKLSDREIWELSRDLLRRLGRPDAGPLPSWWRP